MAKRLCFSCFGSKSSTSHASEASTLIGTKYSLYDAARQGKLEVVETILQTATLEEINATGPKGSTALHAASYYGHTEIVLALLKAGAQRSIKNSFGFTPFEESTSREVRQAFYRQVTGGESKDRFQTNIDSRDWMIKSNDAEKWRKDIYHDMRLTLSFPEMAQYIKEFYIEKHLLEKEMTKRSKEIILSYFDAAIEYKDVRYLVSLYTSTTHFFKHINQDFRDHLLSIFRWYEEDCRLSPLQRAVWYFASIFIHHPDLRRFNFKGQTYRGAIATEADLLMYVPGQIVMNTSFLSTTKDRITAEIFAAFEDPNRINGNKSDDQIQYHVLFHLTIENYTSALEIESISELPFEREVLIKPLCAFRVISIRRNPVENNRSNIEIKLIECHENPVLPYPVT